MNNARNDTDNKASNVVIWSVGVVPEAPITDGAARRLRTLVRQVFHDALPVHLADDRFDADFTRQSDYRAAVALIGDTCVAYLGGGFSRGRLQLEALASVRYFGPESGNFGNAKTDGADSNGWELVETMAQLYVEVTKLIPSNGSSIELWGRPNFDWQSKLAERHGLEQARSLHQLRCTLPIANKLSIVPETGLKLDTRPFRPGKDEELLLAVNNRSFAAHPDQGNMTASDLEQSMQQDWFDPDGIRIYDDPTDSSKLAGFCWTKIHRARNSGQSERNMDLGEIYAIAIDPDHHGKGLGIPMTSSGLEWLAERGLTTGMLYVESDNEPALRTYERIGFSNHRTDRSWKIEL